MYERIRKRIVECSQRMYAEHLVSATSGNISIRIPGREDMFAITPSSESYDTMTAERIVIMTLDGQVIQGPDDGKPSSEWRLHAEIYRAKPSVGAIVHTHSPYATAFAVIRESIPLILIEMQPWLGLRGKIRRIDESGANVDIICLLLVRGSCDVSQAFLQLRPQLFFRHLRPGLIRLKGNPDRSAGQEF